MARISTRIFLAFGGLSILVLGAWHSFLAVSVRFDLLDCQSVRMWLLNRLTPLQTPLLVALGGGALYVLAGLSLPPRRRRRGRVRFDFNAAFAPYLVYEPLRSRLLKWARAIVCLLIGAGLALLLYVMAHELPFMARDFPFIGLSREGAAILSVVLMWTSTVPALVFGPLAWRNLKRGAERSLRGDRRLPILYLRSFEADAGQLGDDEGPITRFLRIVSGIPYTGYEQRLVNALTDVAPVVAVGRPGERLPPLGAARIYLRGDWEPVVAKLVAASRAVLLRIGHTQGFWWELRHVVANCDPQKIIVCLPWRRRKRWYAHLRRRGTDVFPRPLPRSPGDALFLTFDRDWTPRLLPLTLYDRNIAYQVLQAHRSTPLVPLLQRFPIWRVRAMRSALNDALVKLGIPRRPMPLSLDEFLLVIGCLATVLWFRMR